MNCESVAVSRRAKRAADTGVTVMVTTLQNLTREQNQFIGVVDSTCFVKQDNSAESFVLL